jgi:ribosomal protein L11 methyltransferase
MEYTEVRLRGLTQENREAIIYYLGEEGFESFADDGEDLLAYIPSDIYDAQKVDDLCRRFEADHDVRNIPEQNWNETWEKNFNPVLIRGRCLIRAPFHESVPGVEHEIVIMPKMSFGTAHHETTAGMIAMMLDLNMKDKKVLDMGTGTGILAIMAEKLGAREVTAIDNDHWSFENALENVERNNCRRISVMEGGAEKISGDFDIILANINRNILIEQLPFYSGAAHSGTLLMMSGFYEEDLPVISNAAAANGFLLLNSSSENRWVAAIFIK